MNKEHKDRVESLLHQQETPKAEPMRYTTASVLPYLDRQTKHKVITLDLDQGPYKTNMTGNGLYMGIAGRKGHIGILDWKQQNLITEFNVGENIYDFHFFHTYDMYAVAQENSLHIYDSDGTSLHNLREFIQPRYLDFLPYHFLLATICSGNAWKLRYLDVSLGEMIVSHTLSSPIRSMTMNPQNAIIINGHVSGAVTMWSPNMQTPLVALSTHRGSVTSLSVTNDGNYLASFGSDQALKITDLRMMKENTDLTKSHMGKVTCLDYSQRGLLAVGKSNVVEIYNENMQKITVQTPGLKHQDIITSVEFCPYEDFLVAGRYNGVSTIPIPGSGSMEIDTYENNIYESKKSFKEAEVKKLLEKIPADMITLNPKILANVVPNGQKDALMEVVEDLKEEQAKRLAAFEDIKKPQSTKPRVKKIQKTIQEKSALDLFK
ncbi:WD repeat-containing protein [Entamoeba marina]